MLATIGREDNFYQAQLLDAVAAGNTEEIAYLLNSGKECFLSVIGRAAGIALKKKTESENSQNSQRFRIIYEELSSPRSTFAIVRRYHQEANGTDAMRIARQTLAEIDALIGLPPENKTAIP